MLYIYKRYTAIGGLARRLGIQVCWPTPNTPQGLWPRTRRRRATLRQPINWGNAAPSVRDELPQNTLNRDVSVAVDKTLAFSAFAAAGLKRPRWALQAEDLRAQLAPGATILARRNFLSGGKGITVVRDGEPAPAADFYVEFLPYQRELRFHVWQGQIIIEQVKLLPHGNRNPIHSHEHGAIFSTAQSVEGAVGPSLTAESRVAAIRAVVAAGLDFGAVDIFITRRNEVYVLEVNTAPGMEASATYAAYTESLRGLITT